MTCRSEAGIFGPTEEFAGPNYNNTARKHPEKPEVSTELMEYSAITLPEPTVRLAVEPTLIRNTSLPLENMCSQVECRIWESRSLASINAA